MIAFLLGFIGAAGFGYFITGNLIGSLGFGLVVGLLGMRTVSRK